MNNCLARISVISVLSLLIVACSSSPKLSGLNKEPISNWQGYDNPGQLKSYTEEALQKHGRDLLKTVPDDIEMYCPAYADATRWERMQFWNRFISSLSYFESNHKNQVWYQERFNDAQGRPVISRGLLQISIESGNGYQCGLTNPQQLHDPKTNISCGVRILNRWVGQRDKVVSGNTGWLFFSGSWLGAARYWSPFRDEGKKQRIALATRDLPYCKS
ncbi:hypothetical protein [Oceanospirillum sediminis]|uniref:Transglycosylase SLT domain-containing protein n=1 Tax=Oceanospirillum sediminis TaxID=2760088 RepID=A0A839ISH6_9GAMM|nr:hypothetical protein [Oceanospirillum sediminis]MBB1487614.1 hypothetical protein [Oceanospirillum sediminis]